MPNRIIHEKACNSQTLDAVSDSAERLFWRLMTKVDDYGRFEADARILLGACFPLRIGRMKPERVEVMRDELAAAGAIVLYWVEGRLYGSFCAWDKHQRKRESKPKYPDLGLGTPYSPVAANSGELPRLAARARTLGSRESGDVNESRESAQRASGGEPPPAPGVDAPPVFQIPDAVTRALDRALTLGKVGALRRPTYWQAQVRANPGVDLAAEVLRAEAWIQANPHRAPRREFPRFLNTWFGKEREQSHAK